MLFGKKRKEEKARNQAMQARRDLIAKGKPSFEEISDTTAKVLRTNPVDVDWGVQYVNAKAFLESLFKTYPTLCEEVGTKPYELVSGSTIFVTNAEFSSYQKDAYSWRECKDYFTKYYPEWETAKHNNQMSELNNRDNYTVALYLACRGMVKTVNALSSKLVALT